MILVKESSLLQFPLAAFQQTIELESERDSVYNSEGIGQVLV
jgi:hypothetical protein